MRHKTVLKSSWWEARRNNNNIIIQLIIINMQKSGRQKSVLFFSTGVGGKKQCFLKIGGIVDKMDRLFQLFFFQQ